jgi:hypothetical protein
MIDWANANRGKVILTQESERHVWFSGAFTYHMAIDPVTMDTVKGRSGPLRKLLGFELTPDMIWNLTPWSWAIDWVTNTGDVISNLQSWTQDGMVLRWGYVMEHTISRNTFTFVGPTGWLIGGSPPSVTFTTEVKQRRRATPFGFGLKYGEFSNRQKAILAALGISRGRK